MSDYSEHLISMAGGDGDPLDAMQKPGTILTHWEKHLLALVKEQQSTLAAVLALANESGRRGWHVSPAAIRAALETS